MSNNHFQISLTSHERDNKKYTYITRNQGTFSNKRLLMKLFKTLASMRLQFYTVNNILSHCAQNYGSIITINPVYYESLLLNFTKPHSKRLPVYESTFWTVILYCFSLVFYAEVFLWPSTGTLVHSAMFLHTVQDVPFIIMFWKKSANILLDLRVCGVCGRVYFNVQFCFWLRNEML